LGPRVRPYDLVVPEQRVRMDSLMLITRGVW
jgi:hypothetical protein